MASKKKPSIGAQKMAKAKKAKAAREAKKGTAAKAPAVNSALERANAIAKKGTKKASDVATSPIAKKAAKAPKVKASKIDAAADKAVKGADLPPLTNKKAAPPQFFGRKKVTKEVDPVKVREQRNATHAQMMQLDWYADYRKDSIELWVERRKAEAAGDTAAIEKINKKLDAIARKRDKAKAEWKEAGSKLPAVPKAAKPEPVKKGGVSKKMKKEAPVAEEAAPAGSQTVPDTTAAPEPGDVRVTD